MGTVVVSVVLFICVSMIVKSLCKNRIAAKKSGGCGCGCSGCSGCTGCAGSSVSARRNHADEN